MGVCWPLQMPPTPKSVLMSLADNANDQGYCWPSIARISERTCFSKRAVIDAIAWLEKHGIVTADRTNGRHTTYVLKPSAYVEPVQQAHQCGKSTGASAASEPVQQAHQPVHLPHQPVQQPHTNHQEPSLTVMESNRQSARTGDATDGFDEFWDAYPRKEGKKDAAKAWAKLKPSADLLATILAALTIQSASLKWRERGGQFIPHASTYLNGERWTDQMQTATELVVVGGTSPARGKQQQLEDRNKRVASEWLAEQSAASQNQR